jgi:hypothetical protein
VSLPAQPAAPERTDRPAILWNKVVKARAVLAEQRHLPRSQSDWTARDELLSALEAYAANLTDHRRPIPRALRDELKIRRLMGHA